MFIALMMMFIQAPEERHLNADMPLLRSLQDLNDREL
jgi:hypothetical protein